MSGCRNGFIVALLDYVMKQYEGHCRIPRMLEREILMNVDEMQEILAVQFTFYPIGDSEASYVVLVEYVGGYCLRQWSMVDAFFAKISK